MDVKLTKELYDYARKEGKMKYKDLRVAKEIKLDTARWDAPSDAPSMTHALQL
jgi:major membrane immunogen (membrane-anchored lipoprotein)